MGGAFGATLAPAALSRFSEQSLARDQSALETGEGGAGEPGCSVIGETEWPGACRDWSWPRSLSARASEPRVQRWRGNPSPRSP